MAKEQTTAIAVTEKTVGQYVNDTLPALIKNYAMREFDGNAFAKSAALCIVENKDLMACLQTDAGRISLRHALRYAAATGLSLNPQEGKACLVAIDGKVNYWPMKNGLVELILETGAVKAVRMNAIRQNDHFRLTETMDGANYEFSPARKNRGEIEGFFAAAKLTDGSSYVEYMPRDEVEAHRDHYGKGVRREGSAWNSSFEGMGLKTVTKRLCKRLALPSGKTTDALAAAIEIGEPVPARFEETGGHGTSASDVERKLAPAPAAVHPVAEGSPAAAAPEGGQQAQTGEGQPGLDIF